MAIVRGRRCRNLRDLDVYAVRTLEPGAATVDTIVVLVDVGRVLLTHEDNVRASGCRRRGRPTLWAFDRGDLRVDLG